jgi:predicted PurR-regulated permease PerM
MSVLSFASAAGLTALVVYLLVVGGPILAPLVIAVFVWYLINALSTVSRRLRFRGKVLPAGVRMGAATLALALLGSLMVNLVIGNVGHVVANAPTYEQNLNAAAAKVAHWIGVEEGLPPVQALYQGRLTSVVRSLATSAAGLAASLGTIAIYVVFLLLEQHSFSKKIARLFPSPEREARVHRVLTRIGQDVQSYVWLKTVMSALTAGASYAVMKFVGVDLAAFWAILIFGLNFIPYIGSWLGVIFPTALTLVQFDTLQPFFTTAILLSIVQFIGGSIIEPRLMGKGLNISPVVMLLSLAIWGTIWGVVGMFLAVPLMVVLMIVFAQFESTRPIAILMSADGELRT